MIHINQHLINKMLVEARTAYPHECCGLIVGNIKDSGKVVHDVCPVENKNKVRAADRYEIDSKEFDRIDREASKKGWNIIGIYHSHPDHPAAPSDFDKECACVWTEYSYIIISVKNGVDDDLRCWRFDSGKKEVGEEEVKINRRNFKIGLLLMGLSFTAYFVVPGICFLPLSSKIKASSACISYFCISWGLMGLGICFAGKEGYELLKEKMLKGFFRKFIGNEK
ncbi:MAG: M67 family metallopeptidase [Candidatus Brocadiaceae bacterium]|nr:M67 family metallopeptidase [Candidatus Brocadiaceae bacterium]